MDSVAVGGLFTLAGVLLGALVTYGLSQRADKLRLAAEDERRWLNDRRNIYARYLGLCFDLLEALDRVGTFLRYDETDSTDEADEAIIAEDLPEWHERWTDELHPALSELQLMATPAVSDLADRSAHGIMEASASVEVRAPFVEFYPVWFQARDLVQVLRNAMRTELGLAPIPDDGPVRDPNWPWLPGRPDRNSYRQGNARAAAAQRHPSALP